MAISLNNEGGKMRIETTQTGKTIFITKRLWIHWFNRSQKLIWDWGVYKGAIHTPWFIIAR